jgi:hypothetical protein
MAKIKVTTPQGVGAEGEVTEKEFKQITDILERSQSSKRKEGNPEVVSGNANITVAVRNVLARRIQTKANHTPENARVIANGVIKRHGGVERILKEASPEFKDEVRKELQSQSEKSPEGGSMGNPVSQETLNNWLDRAKNMEALVKTAWLSDDLSILESTLKAWIDDVKKHKK